MVGLGEPTMDNLFGNMEDALLLMPLASVTLAMNFYAWCWAGLELGA